MNPIATLSEDDMVYTEERLKQAIAVFRASEPYRKRRSLPGGNLGKLLESRCRQYETRSGKAALAVRTTITGTWNDKDESGDYLPGRSKKTARTPKSLQNGPTKRKGCDASGRDVNRAPKRTKTTYTSGRQKGLSLEVTFKLSSATAKAKIAELFPSATMIPDMEVQETQDVVGTAGRDDFGGEGSILVGGDEVPFPGSPQSTYLHSEDPVIRSLEYYDEDCDHTSPESSPDNQPVYDGLPTACMSDPIVIDDSDDSMSGFGGFSAEIDEQTTQIKRVITNWAHPIQYRCKPELCDFCKDYRYPIFGCGAVEVEVIKLEPGVYEEMGGGNREKGVAPTNICLTCSLERITIAKCHDHQILPIDGQSEKDFDYSSFWNHIATSSEAIYATCSICIKPAFYACATQQQHDPFGLPVTGSDAIGCGLLLCGDCARIVARRGLDLQCLEHSAQSTGRMPRADRQFLVPGSDLWQAWET